MRAKHHNVALIDKMIQLTVDVSGDYYTSKCHTHGHNRVNAVAFSKLEVSMRALEVLSRLGINLERVIAANLRRRALTTGEEFADLKTQIEDVQLSFSQAISALASCHVIMNVLRDAVGEIDVSSISFVHTAFSHGLRKAYEEHQNHHRDHSVKPMLSRFGNAIKCTVDGKYIDAIRDVTIAVYMTELDIDPSVSHSGKNPVNLTGELAAYDGE